MTTAITTQPAASGFALAMSPTTVADAHAFCTMLSKTEFVPKAFRGKPDSIMVVGAMGARLGVDVFTAMAGIADINGKPAIYGDLMLAVCQNHPAFVDCVETFEGKPYDSEFRAVCVACRKGREPVTRSFSVQEAIEAGLWKKTLTWTTVPQRMLQMRARAFALRDTFADALAGFHAREELEDAITVEHERVPAAQPARVREITTSAPAPVEPVATVSSGNATEPVAGDEPVIVVDDQPIEITTQFLQEELTILWKAQPGGKEIAKGLLKKWGLTQVSDMGGSDQDTRGKFLAEIRAEVAVLAKGGVK